MKSKYIISNLFFLVILLLLFCTGANAAVDDSIPQEIKEKISAAYLIPIEDLDDMTLSDITPLLDDLDSAVLECSETVYICVKENEYGEVTCESYTEEEYLQMNFASSVDSTTDTYSVMQIVTSIGSYSSTIGYANATFTWLTVPSFRLTDYVALLILNGTIIDDSEYGYYKCTYNNDSGGGTTTKTTTFSSSAFTTQARFLTAKFAMLKPDTTVTADKAHIYLKFTKSGSSDAVTSYYFHGKVSVTPSIELSDSTGLSITPSYAFDSYTGYKDITW